MIFNDTAIPDAFTVDPERAHDERGFFARLWSRAAFVERGLEPNFAVCAMSFSPARGTLRGMHYQLAPHAEAKLVSCTRGSLFDVVVDLRPQSPAFRRWWAVELTSDNHRMLYVPRGCAHGFLTLSDDTEVLYHLSEEHYPELARGVRWNDPAFLIEWPFPPAVMSSRDASYEDFPI